MLTLQSVIVIAVGWSAIYWQWTDTRLATIIGFVVAYFVTLAVLAVRGQWGRGMIWRRRQAEPCRLGNVLYGQTSVR
jgi:hypothetical protein